MDNPILGQETTLSDHSVSAVSFAKAMNKSAENSNPGKPLYTGRYFAILNDGVKNFKKTTKIFHNSAGLTTASFSDFSTQEPGGAASLTQADVLTYDHLGVALVSGTDQQLQAVEDNNVEYILVPEKVVYVPVDIISTNMGFATWGLDITRVTNSAYTGKGVKIAILDTGFDFSHPDFKGRNITQQSFVPNETADDKHGHGTHCIGTACGKSDNAQVRYGVATESDIYVGKVLNNQGSGAQQYLLDGITWAVDNGCKVISMSLSSRVFPGTGYDLIYERAAQYANSKGAILVAASGNESHRSMGIFNPVGSPADCPSILAVAAVDANLNIADFSNRSINEHAQVDIAAPGVDVYSSWPMPKRYRRISGTSMATPHVAGILALFWEKYPNYNYQQITMEMLKFAKRLPLASIDAGNGLIISP
jgi:subtilisin family serine protease